MSVKKGDTVKVEYEGTFDDGSVFDTTSGREPLAFQVGAGQVIPGFEKAVIGMAEGEEKDVRLESSDAYGDHNPELIQEMPRGSLPDEVQEGTILAATLEDGMQMPVKVVDVSDERVKVDLNHPLAGKALNFKVKVAEVG